MHKNSYKVTEDKKETDAQEKEANDFASYFLIPEKAFAESWEENKGLHWVDNVLHIKRVYKVSYLTVILRLVKLGVNESYPSLCAKFIESLKIKYGKTVRTRKEEPFPLDSIDFVEDRLRRLARDAYEKELISFSRVAEILKYNNDMARQLISSWEWESEHEIN